MTRLSEGQRIEVLRVGDDYEFVVYDANGSATATVRMDRERGEALCASIE